jgi:NAD(P)-dependent dehydrogenase (short-subunit alcohol dehydrogenase family)
MPTDRLAIVSGTSSGIGLATARLLLDEGWIVHGLSRRDAPVKDRSRAASRNFLDRGGVDDVRR